MPPSDGAGNGRTARGSGSSEPETGRPDKTGGRPDQGPAESAGGGSNGDIEGSGKSTPHEFAGQVDSGNSHGHKTDDDDPALDNKGHGGTGDQELYGTVAQLAQRVAPYGSAETSSQDNTAAHTKSWVAYDFTYDKSELPRYPDNVQEVASSISYALDAKTREQTGTFATGAGIVTTSRFDDVVDWYRKNLPAGWQSSSIGDFGQLAQATQGPGGDLMKLLKGEMPGAAPTSGGTKSAVPKVRVALFKAPTTHAGSPDSTIMILQKDDKPVSVYLQTASK